jgi:hypothetical protein
LRWHTRSPFCAIPQDHKSDRLQEQFNGAPDRKVLAEDFALFLLLFLPLENRFRTTVRTTPAGSHVAACCCLIKGERKVVLCAKRLTKCASFEAIGALVRFREPAVAGKFSRR